MKKKNLNINFIINKHQPIQQQGYVSLSYRTRVMYVCIYVLTTYDYE